jgi:hypothetical protein
MGFVLALAAGFMVGFVIPTRVMVMCLVPVAVVAVDFGYARLLGGSISAIGVLIDIVIAYPTAFSINRFMHD